MSLEERNLGYLLNKAARLTKWELNNKLNELELTSSQWVVLKDIYCFEKIGDKAQNLTPAAIAERLHSDRPTISGIIHRLTHHGWVYRINNPEDRRSQIILVTEKTKTWMPRMEQLGNETMEQAIKGFSEEEIGELRSYLIRIINNFI